MNKNLAYEDLLNITQSLKVAVKGGEIKETTYGWGSHHTRKPLFIKTKDK